MSSPSTPHNEPSRLAALREYQILDTLPEAAYDDITRIAAQICETPIALVSLVDDQRQWFKSRRGIDARETPRDVAFCAHAILQPDEPLVIEDAREDPRFAHNPLVTGPPGIRFYAGAPLVTSDGHALGTLCVIDRRPRTLSGQQLESLEALARQVVALMELRRAVARLEHNGQELERRNEQVMKSRDELVSLCSLLEDQAAVMERDLNRAEVIQRSLLPHELPPLEGICVHTLYRPGRSIGGDLFDLVAVGDRYLALVIADAAGHGVSAAMISMLFKNRLELTDEDGRPFRPCEALGRLNRAMQHDKPAPGVFVTAVIGLLDVKQRRLALASAGHPPVVWVHAGGEVEPIVHTGPALGLYPDAEFGERVVDLEEADRVLFYTDGLLDGGHRAVPTPEVIGEALRGISGEGETLRELLDAVGGDANAEDRDDVSLVLLESRAGEHYLDEPVELAGGRVDGQRTLPRLHYAETRSTTFLVLEGRVTWLCGQALLDSALSVIDGGRRLVIDLTDCVYLDSTVLGTLHELIQWAAERQADLVLQNVSESVADAFRELSMQAVLDRVTDSPEAVPAARYPVRLPDHSRTAHQQRLLRAHEVLAELSDANRETFAGVLDALRGEDTDDSR